MWAIKGYEYGNAVKNTFYWSWGSLRRERLPLCNKHFFLKLQYLSRQLKSIEWIDLL